MYARTYIEYGYLYGYVQPNYVLIRSKRINTYHWRLDFHSGRWCMRPMYLDNTSLTRAVDFVSDMFQISHFDFFKLSSAPLPLSHVFPPANLWKSNLPAVKKKGESQFCLYYLSKTINSGN